jgi:uncharacterized protein with PIN domain
MKTKGFIVDKNLSKVGRMISDRGYDCKVVDNADLEKVCEMAIREDRVFLTSNLKIFNKKVQMPRGCLHYKANPFSKYNYHSNNNL